MSGSAYFLKMRTVITVHLPWQQQNTVPLIGWWDSSPSWLVIWVSFSILLNCFRFHTTSKRSSVREVVVIDKLTTSWRWELKEWEARYTILQGNSSQLPSCDHQTSCYLKGVRGVTYYVIISKLADGTEQSSLCNLTRPHHKRIQSSLWTFKTSLCVP